MIVRVAGPGSMLGLYAVFRMASTKFQPSRLPPRNSVPSSANRSRLSAHHQRGPDARRSSASARSTALPCEDAAASPWPRP